MPEIEAFFAPNSRWCCRRMRLTEAEMQTYTFRVRHETVMFYIPSKFKVCCIVFISSWYRAQYPRAQTLQQALTRLEHRHWRDCPCRCLWWRLVTAWLPFMSQACRIWRYNLHTYVPLWHKTPPSSNYSIQRKKRAAKYVVLKPLIAAACLRHPPDLSVNRESTGSCWLNWQNEPLNVCPLFPPLPLISRLCQLAADFAAIFPAHCFVL